MGGVQLNRREKHLVRMSLAFGFYYDPFPYQIGIHYHLRHSIAIFESVGSGTTSKPSPKGNSCPIGISEFCHLFSRYEERPNQEPLSCIRPVNISIGSFIVHIEHGKMTQRGNYFLQKYPSSCSSLCDCSKTTIITSNHEFRIKRIWYTKHLLIWMNPFMIM